MILAADFSIAAALPQPRTGIVMVMLDSVLTATAEYLQKRTAFPGWVAEFLVSFAVATMARFAVAVWNGIMLGREPLWAALWTAYDNLTLYSEDSAILALIVTIIVEVIIMVLARKRIRIEREEGREEGRAEARAELEPIIAELQERIRRLENGHSEPQSSPTPTP